MLLLPNIVRCFILILLTLLPQIAFSVVVQPPELAVKAYLLKDVQSQSVIAEFNSDTSVEPASLTKLMTAYLAFEAIEQGILNKTTTVTVSNQAFKAEGSRMFVEPRKPVTVEELLYGLIVQSGNDAAIALAEQIAVTESAFADKMNEKAEALGMTQTHYVNATGLPDPAHTTSANDLMRLSEALIRDYPEAFKQYYATKTYTYNKIKQDNRNRLLWLDPHVDGLKTGHTKSAGYCLIATSVRDGVRRIAITLGAKSKAARTSETQKLLNFGFQHYATTLLYKKGAPIKSEGQQAKILKVWKGVQDQVNVTVAKDVVVTVPKTQLKELAATLSSVQPLVAPIKAEQTVGEIKVTLSGETIQSIPLVAATAIPSAGILGQLWDTIRLFINGLLE